MRVVKESPRKTVHLGLIVIYSGQPLRPVVGRREGVRRGCELRQPSIDARPRVHTQLGGKWRSRTAQIVERAEIQIEPWVVREQRAEAGHCVSRGDLHEIVAGGMAILLLESGKEERSIFLNRTARGKTVDIVYERCLFNAV